VAALQAEGIPCSRRYPTPIHMQHVFTAKKGFGQTSAPFTPPWHEGEVTYGAGQLPAAERLPNDLVRLLMNPRLTRADLEDMARGVRKVAAAFAAA
jgi:dTDP-4-amino-4,6-dideoxygalactose transaminase